MMSYFKYYFDTSDLKLSLGAEKLLNIFRDRYELSAKTGFTGKNGNVVFLIKMTEIAELLGKTERTAQRVLNELRKKGLVFTQKRQSGILEFSLINNFPHDKNVSFQTDKNVSFQTDKNVSFQTDKNVSFQTDKNGKMIHISQTKQARLTKPNARMRTHESEQNELSQNQPSEATSRHSFSRAELGNSRIPSQAQAPSQTQGQNQTQSQTQTPSKNQAPNQAQHKTQAQDKTQAQTQAPSQSKPQTQAQDKTQEPKASRQWLGINDKPSYISEQTWQDFCAYKRERRHNFTATGKKAFFAKLDDIQTKSGACETAIKNTMANGWQGVFMPPLDKSLGKGQAMQPAQMVDALQEWLSDRQAQVIESVESIQSKQGEQALPQALPSRDKRRA